MKILFFKNFLKNWRQVGSITPSSRFLTSRMLKSIDFSKNLIIVELGPGTGVFTKEILSRMNSDSKLLALETNKEFYEDLKKIKDKKFTLMSTSANDLCSVLDGKKVDIVISGIPFSAIKRDLREKMLVEIKESIKDKGKFIQFQYSLDLYKLLNKLFDNKVEINFVPLNVPPAFVYTCRV